MKLKHKLSVFFATIALLSVPFACIGCSQNDATESKPEFGDWVIVVSPSCDNAGVEVRTAIDDPLITETRAIPATGHDWNEWETVSEPTCLVAGVETRTCNTCENSDMRAIPALGHNWGEWDTVLEADCDDCGTEVRVCLRDGKHTEYQSIPALGHDFGDWVLTAAPTCTDKGVERRYCRNNNRHTELRTVQPLGHNYGATVTTKRATCTEQGEQITVCVNDSSHVYITPIQAHGHDFGDWVTSVPATESETGEDFRVCRHDSSHIETRVSPAIGSVDGLLFDLNSEGTEYSIRGSNVNKPTGTVYIPAEYNGLPVTTIGSLYGTDIEHVVFLGNNLKKILNGAFSGCNKLESIEIPEGVTSIGTRAFSGKNLKSISFPSTVVNMGWRTGDVSFIGFIMNCPALETITVAEGNTTYKADGGCLIETATGAVIGGTRNAVIPEYATAILPFAFSNSAIENIRIPANISSIGYEAFSRCKELREVIFENGKLTALEGRLYPSQANWVNKMFAYCDNLERVVLSDNITYIGRNTFLNCRSLREVVLGNNLQEINSAAFDGCTAIKVLEIPASVTDISHPFSGWTAEQTIIVKGFASQEEADKAWGKSWRSDCNATIVYEG